jgi:hypothetical protein
VHYDVTRCPGLAQGVFRRGLQLEALREFIINQGASKNVTLQARALSLGTLEGVVVAS